MATRSWQYLCRCILYWLEHSSFLCLSTCQSDPSMSPKESTRQSQRHSTCTSLTYTNLVSPSTPTTVQTTMDLQTISQSSSACSTQPKAPTSSETSPNGLSALRGSFRQYNLSEAVTDILMSSWRPGTQKQYKTYINKWLEFCRKRTITHSLPKISET